MRTLVAVVIAVLAAGSIGQAVLLFKLRGEVRTLEKRLAAAPSDRGEPREAQGTPQPAPALARLSERAEAGAAVPPPRRRAPAPAAPDEAPLPESIASPEAREQLRHFVASEMRRAQLDQREARMSRREERELEAVDRATKALGLSADEAKKLGDITGALQTARRELLEQVRGGGKTQAEIGPLVAAARTTAEKELRALLGEERFAKYEELRRVDGSPPPAAPPPAPPSPRRP
jgi:hypothetical protein